MPLVGFPIDLHVNIMSAYPTIALRLALYCLPHPAVMLQCKTFGADPLAEKFT
jgi:hypothetical protein